MLRVVAIPLAILFLMLSGCAQAASQPAASPPARVIEQTASLEEVDSPSAEDSETLSRFMSTRGQPAGGHPIEFHWTRVGADEIPQTLVPSDTLGRKLVVALAVSSNLTTPTATDPVAHIEMLLEGGLVLSATTDRRTQHTVETWNRLANESVLEADPLFSRIETAPVGEAVALIRVGPALSGFADQAVNIEWVNPPWKHSVELRGPDTSAALRVARSVGE